MAMERSGPIVPDTTTWQRWRSVAEGDHVVPLLYQLVDRVPTDLSDDDRWGIDYFQAEAQSRFVRLEHHLILVAGRSRRTASAPQSSREVPLPISTIPIRHGGRSPTSIC